MDYHRMAELQHTVRANAYSLRNHHEKATRQSIVKQSSDGPGPRISAP